MSESTGFVFAARRRTRWLAIAFALLAMGLPRAAQAQTSIAFSGGPASYDLSGTGWSGTASVYFERSFEKWLRVEAGSGLFWYTTQSNRGVTMLLPEVGIMFQAPDPLPLYIGGGAGTTVGLRGSQPEELTLYGALGLSFKMLGPWTLRPEMRVRVIEPFVGTIGGFTIGVSRRIGP